MALVVESTTIASANNADNLTINKPTGVEVGDLLLIAATGNSGTPSVSGFSTAKSKVQNSIVYITLLYRIADASDVSASTYTITLAGTTSLGVAAMLRVSGWATGNPVYTSSDAGTSADPVTTSGASGLTLTRPSASLLILVNGFYSNDSPKSSATFSNYSVTSSGANPTWTEVQDAEVGLLDNIHNVALSVAYANDSDTSNITAYNTDVASDTNGAADYIASFLAVICEPLNAQGTNALLDVTPTTFSNTAVEVGTVGTNDFHEVTPTINAQSGRATSPTQWANEAKPSTTWTNEQK